MNLPSFARRCGAGLALGAALPLVAHAQYEADALRYSLQQSTGTSRTQAMGGAGAALGADLGAIVLNPANVGAYRRTEVSFSPGLLLTSANSTTAGFAGSTPADRSGVNFSNFGMVLANRKPDTDDSPWRSGNFVFNFSRLTTFSADRSYSARFDATRPVGALAFFENSFAGGSTNTPTRIDAANNVLANYNDNVIGNFADLGYAGYAFDFYYQPQIRPNGDTVFTPTGELLLPKQVGTTTQREMTEMRGAMNQIDIGYGGSFRDKLYLGASLGIVTLRYKQTRTLTETNDSPTSDLKSLSLTDGYEVNGGGINLRVGAVFVPVDALRLGVAIQTPTWFGELKEQAAPIQLTTAFNNPFPPNSTIQSTGTTASVDASAFQYTLTTPFKATGGLTIVGGKRGLISGDVEYVNYGAARMGNANNDNSYDFSPTNQAIRDLYRSTVNYRLGGELRLADVFRLRAGYAYYGSPYVDSNLKSDRTVISAGMGLRFASWYVDGALSRLEYEQPYSPYTLTTGLEPRVSTKYTIWNPTVTFGFIFNSNN